MHFCDHCGKEKNPFDRHGNEGWICPNECEDEEFIDKIRKEEAAKSDAQRAAEDDDMMDD
jgi:hypothetical protein